MIELFPSRTIAIELFGFPIHWYGIMYLLAFAVAWVLLPRLAKFRDIKWTKDDWSSFLSWCVIGVLVGGRLGFVIFYQPALLWEDPLEILKVWHGGMSSHGGFIGVILALVWFTRRTHTDVRKVADVIAVPVAIGLAFGRLGNFINQELYGIPTSLPWGITVPSEPGPVHPTQLYAIAKDLFIAAACFFHLRRSSVPGRTIALFLILYGILRFVVEHFRIQDYDGVWLLTRGQLLTLPVIALGIGVWLFTRRAARR